MLFVSELHGTCHLPTAYAQPACMEQLPVFQKRAGQLLAAQHGTCSSDPGCMACMQLYSSLFLPAFMASLNVFQGRTF